MAPRRKKSSKNGTYKKKGTARTAYKKSSAPMATRGFSFPIPEKKYKDMTIAILTCNTTGAFQLMNGLVMGTTYNDRIGRRICIKSIYIRGMVGQEGSFTTITSPLVSQGQLCRLIVVADMQPNGAVPALTDVLFEATSLAQLNPNNRDRFKILVDKQWAVGRLIYDTTNGIAALDNCQWPVKKFKKLNLSTTYNGGNTGGIGDIATGALYMLWVGSESAGTDTDCAFFGTARIRYYDN